MRSVSNLAYLELLALLIGVAGCRSVPAPDAPKDYDYPEHAASSKAKTVLDQAEQQDEATALPLYRQYLFLCPWDLKAREKIANDEFDLHQYQSSLQDNLALLKYVHTHDTPAWDFGISDQTFIWNSIGHCYLELHQPDKALEYYRKVGEYEESFYTHYNFARTYIQLKDYCSASYHLKLMETWLPAHQDYVNEIKSQLPEDPCRHRPGAN
jgi:tetratricopeptide (TPR) repeat protein